MEIIKKSDLIKNISKAWDEQYGTQHGKCSDADKIKIGERLRNERPETEDQITSIIGNSSWTDNHCGECGKDSPILVQLGEVPDYESATACICPECLMNAFDLLEQNTENII